MSSGSGMFINGLDGRIDDTSFVFCELNCCPFDNWGNCWREAWKVGAKVNRVGGNVWTGCGLFTNAVLWSWALLPG